MHSARQEALALSMELRRQRFGGVMAVVLDKITAIPAHTEAIKDREKPVFAIHPSRGWNSERTCAESTNDAPQAHINAGLKMDFTWRFRSIRVEMTCNSIQQVVHLVIVPLGKNLVNYVTD